jgi:hypothetical protein
MEPERIELSTKERERLKVLQQVELTELAAEQLEELKVKFGPKGASEEASETTTVQPDPVADCARDYKTLSGREFQRVWKGTRRSVYEEAISRGLI